MNSSGASGKKRKVDPQETLAKAIEFVSKGVEPVYVLRHHRIVEGIETLSVESSNVDDNLSSLNQFTRKGLTVGMAKKKAVGKGAAAVNMWLGVNFQKIIDSNTGGDQAKTFVILINMTLKNRKRSLLRLESALAAVNSINEQLHQKLGSHWKGFYEMSFQDIIAFFVDAQKKADMNDANMNEVVADIGRLFSALVHCAKIHDSIASREATIDQIRTDCKTLAAMSAAISVEEAVNRGFFNDDSFQTQAFDEEMENEEDEAAEAEAAEAAAVGCSAGLPHGAAGGTGGVGSGMNTPATPKMTDEEIEAEEALKEEELATRSRFTMAAMSKSLTEAVLSEGVRAEPYSPTPEDDDEEDILSYNSQEM